MSSAQDPIYLGHYPEYLKEMLGERLPELTPTELSVVLGSSDFYGMNTYTTNLCSECIICLLVHSWAGGEKEVIWHVLTNELYCAVAGGDNEFQGNAKYTFTRPDGTQLGTQGGLSVIWMVVLLLTDYLAHCSWLQDCECYASC